MPVCWKTRKIEMDEKRKYALEFASNAEKAKELKAMMEEAHYEYEDRSRRLQDWKRIWHCVRRNDEM